MADGDDGTRAGNYAQAYGRLALLPETLALASSLPVSVAAHAQPHIQVATSPDTPLIRLTGSAADAADAAGFANAAAGALVQYGRAHRSETGVRVMLMNQADPPRVASSPDLPLNTAVGTACGVLLAVLVAAARTGRRRGAPTSSGPGLWSRGCPACGTVFVAGAAGVGAVPGAGPDAGADPGTGGGKLGQSAPLVVGK
ncbi:hypothetical protein [Actinomadura xylanilytica]|uniref:hypothetical protein n=1 Tax=Actinomadura xylanilytica TaxID=887459 RepID=UPI00255B1E8D|nr:hypothetical protein [Actinomadura xylanilytica]MDL4773213.1 hypothetical protein [Actinomadura xylanilytica]